MRRRDLLKQGVGSVLAPKLAAAAPLPNIVLMFADDLGYGDLGCYGHPTIMTPNLDRMAGEGMRFTQFCSAASVCTPSRAGLMTGRLPIRFGLTKGLAPWSEDGIPEDEITVAEVLKEAGYITMCIGKWHLGHLPRYLPPNHGFDRYFGIPYSNDMSKATNPRAPWADKTPPTPLIRGLETIEREPDQSVLTQRYTEEATRWIRESSRSGKPFFLFMPHMAVHWPHSASGRFRGRSRAGLFGDMLEELDWSAGEILRTLREENVDGGTLVIFTSDNGAEGGSAGPLRDGKMTTWEGGFRVPCIARWPGKVPAGVVTPAFGTTMDLFPTLVKLAGRKMPEDRVFDGEDLSPVLFGAGSGREPLLFYYRDENLNAVRKGKWKLHVAVINRKMAPPGGEGEPPLLFDVERDIAERRDVAQSNPDVVKELLKLIERHKASFKPGPPQR